MVVTVGSEVDISDSEDSYHRKERKRLEDENRKLKKELSEEKKKKECVKAKCLRRGEMIDALIALHFDNRTVKKRVQDIKQEGW